MKTKAHTRYKLTDGTPVPGVTTICEQLGWNKRVLMGWVSKCCEQGIDWRRYKDDKAEIGTLAHAMIIDRLVGRPTDTSDYSKNQIDAAENAYLSFCEWEKSNRIEKVFLAEQPLVSEALKFGGTEDLFVQINLKVGLIDIKSGSGIYDEHKVQVTAYERLVTENNQRFRKCLPLWPGMAFYEDTVLPRLDFIKILNVPRTEDESFICVDVTAREKWWAIFYNALQIYHTYRDLKGGTNARKNYQRKSSVNKPSRSRRNAESSS